jgi:hypothetical protein
MPDHRIMLNEHAEILVVSNLKYKLGEPIFGRHEFCGGFIEAKRVSEKYNAVFCDSCNLRVAVPVGVTDSILLEKHLDGFKYKSIAA